MRTERRRGRVPKEGQEDEGQDQAEEEEEHAHGHADTDTEGHAQRDGGAAASASVPVDGDDGLGRAGTVAGLHTGARQHPKLVQAARVIHWWWWRWWLWCGQLTTQCGAVQCSADTVIR
jgi:hypothetical protein